VTGGQGNVKIAVGNRRIQRLGIVGLSSPAGVHAAVAADLVFDRGLDALAGQRCPGIRVGDPVIEFPVDRKGGGRQAAARSEGGDGEDDDSVHWMLSVVTW